jgi:NADPH2:quinone reductase
MRCAVIARHGKDLHCLQIVKRPDLKATGEDIRVRVAAAAINRADLLQRRGLYPAPAGTVADIPGLEFVGRVDQLGEKVTDWRGGERVFGIVPGGAYAEQVLIHQRLAVQVPDALSDAEAAAVPEVFIAAHDALVSQGGMTSGDLVLIYAVAGGVGSAAVQLVSIWGARAVGVAGSEEKLRKVAEFASFHPINYKADSVKEAVEKTSGRHAVDLVLDTVGAAYWPANLELLGDGGRLVLLGLLSGRAAETSLQTILQRRLRIFGTILRSRPLEERVLASRAFAREVVPHFASGRLRPVVDTVFPFHRLLEATARMENRQNVGKIVLTFP